MKASIREMPVTMSASSIGMLFKPIIRLRPVGFIALMPMAAAVPSTVAISADRKAISKVLCKACMMVAFEKSSPYHLRVKPPQRVLDLLSLKESTIIVKMGR